MLRTELGPTAVCLVGNVAAEGRFLNQNTSCHWKSKVWVTGSSLPGQSILCDRKGKKEELLAENCNLWSLQGVGETYGTDSWAPGAAGPTAALNCCWEHFLTLPWDHPLLAGRKWGTKLRKGQSSLFFTTWEPVPGTRTGSAPCLLSFQVICTKHRRKIVLYARPLHWLSLGQRQLWHHHFASPSVPELTDSRGHRTIGTDSSLDWTWPLPGGA